MACLAECVALLSVNDECLLEVVDRLGGALCAEPVSAEVLQDFGDIVEVVVLPGGFQSEGEVVGGFVVVAEPAVRFTQVLQYRRRVWFAELLGDFEGLGEVGDGFAR